MAIFTDRIVLVFPIAEKSRPAGASLQTLEIVNGREFETLVPLDPQAVAQYASEFNLPMIAERDQLQADKATLETSLSEMTADRDKQASDLAAKVAELETLQATYSELVLSNQASQEANQAIQSNLASMTSERDELRDESASKSETIDLLQMQYDTMAGVAANLPTVEAERNAALSQLHEAQATIASLNEQLAKPVVESRPGLNYLYPYEFRHRFTPESRARLREAAKTNDQLADYLETVFSVRWVVVTDQETIQGVQALALMGLIDPARVSEILAPVSSL